MLDFPNSPTTNQVFTAPNGTAWTWDGAKWISGATGSGFLPLSGGTLTGPLTLQGNPTAALQAVTKEYVDTPVTSLWSNIRYRNRIINGDMAVDQRSGGNMIAAPAASAYIIDRWKFGTNIASKGSVGQQAMGAPPQAATGGFQYCLSWQTTAAYAPAAAADSLQWSQYVEGCNFNDTMWGTANAQPVTLEFWVQASTPGTYAVALRNGAGTRSYVATFTVPTASVWTKVRLNIPGDQIGTWAVAANINASNLSFNLGGGSNFATTPGAWQAGNFYTAAGVVNPVATLNAYLYITGVALMVGANAQNAEPAFKSYADNLIDCQRYYQVLGAAILASGYTPATGTGIYGALSFNNMRANPTVTYGTITYGVCGSLTTNRLTQSTISFQATSNAAGGATAAGSVTLDADF
jgi:hypothetical protein